MGQTYPDVNRPGHRSHDRFMTIHKRHSYFPCRRKVEQHAKKNDLKNEICLSEQRDYIPQTAEDKKGKENHFISLSFKEGETFFQNFQLHARLRQKW